MTDWQPIETAPKDGTKILLAGGKDDNSEHVSGREEANMLLPSSGWWDGFHWIITIAEAGHIGVYRENPTHWMPLPEPPSGEGGR